MLRVPWLFRDAFLQANRSFTRALTRCVAVGRAATAAAATVAADGAATQLHRDIRALDFQR